MFDLNRNSLINRLLSGALLVTTPFTLAAQQKNNPHRLVVGSDHQDLHIRTMDKAATNITRLLFETETLSLSQSHALAKATCDLITKTEISGCGIQLDYKVRDYKKHRSDSVKFDTFIMDDIIQRDDSFATGHPVNALPVDLDRDTNAIRTFEQRVRTILLPHPKQ